MKLFYIKMKATVTFCYEKSTIDIQCTNEEEMKNIFHKFAIKFNSDEDNFDFFYEKKKINNNSSILKLTGIKNKKTINIFVERKSKIIKCPICICNDTVIKIENFRLNFYGCKYGHSDIKIFDHYKKSQEIDYSQIKCSKSGCNSNAMFNDFFKCLDCTKKNKRTTYYCNK